MERQNSRVKRPGNDIRQTIRKNNESEFQDRQSNRTFEMENLLCGNFPQEDNQLP